jgi:hypothetical protein
LGRRWITALSFTATIGWTQGGDAKITAGFLDRIGAYVQQRQKLESSATALPKQATPEQIDQHQQTLAAAVRAARSAAVPGEVFGADMTALIKRRFRALFSGAPGRRLRHDILDEYPGPTPVSVNGRYPDRVPLTNMPAPVLKQLPALPDEIEFRFVGDQLILFDPHSHLVIDFIKNALPGA